jgi:hypothetical protein
MKLRSHVSSNPFKNRKPLSAALSFNLVHFAVASTLLLSAIEAELVRVASDLHPVTVRIEKGDGSIAGDFQSFRPAHDGNLSALENWHQPVYLFGSPHIDAEMVQLRRSVATRELSPVWQLHERDIVVFPTETQKRHLGPPIARGNLHTENRAIKLFRPLEIPNVEDNVAQDSIVNRHREPITNDRAALSRQSSER